MPNDLHTMRIVSSRPGSHGRCSRCLAHWRPFPQPPWRRTGGDGGDQGGPATSDRNSTEPRSNLPLNLAQLRSKRAEAAEARLPKEGSSNASSSLGLHSHACTQGG